MKGEKITFIVLGLILIIGFSYYQLKDETFNLPFGNPLNKKSADFKEFYIDVSEGDTEVEKTVLIKYNNVLVEAEKIYNKRLSGKEVTTKETRLCEAIYNDFFSYLRKNETNIQDKLWQNIQTKMEAFVKYSANLPLDNKADIEKEERLETKRKEKMDNTPNYETVPELADIAEGARSNDDYAPFRKVNNIYKNRQSACNRGSEPLIDFIERFCDDKEFRKSRIKLSKRVDIVNKINRKTFEITVPDRNGFFMSWDDIEDNSAFFSSGWMESEMSERYEFRRIDGEWYLVDYIEYS